MTRQRRPLLLTADPELLDQLLGMAAAVGVAVDVAVEPTTCHPQWTDAPLVLLGADLAAEATVARLGPRADVLLVGQGTPPSELSGIAATIGAVEVVGLPSGEAVLLERLADAAEPATPARMIGVVGGRGGAGTSVLAAGLALTAARGGPSWLVDLDPVGGGADAGLGAELSAGARWSDLSALTGRLSPHALRAALPEVEGVAVVAADGRSGLDLTLEAVRAVVAAASRGGGTVVLDLGRNRTAARDEAVAALDDLLLLVPAELRAVLAARRVVQSLGPSAPTPRVVVRAVPAALPSREVAPALDLTLAGELPDEMAVRAAIQTGDPAALLRDSELAALCEAILVVPTALRAAA
jgi:secretion/DNA translocation related CpaE-like protein